MPKQAASNVSTPLMNLQRSPLLPHTQLHQKSSALARSAGGKHVTFVYTGLSHLPNLEPGLCDTLGAAESTSQRSSGVTRAESVVWPPAAGSEKRPAQVSIAMTSCLPLQRVTCSSASCGQQAILFAQNRVIEGEHLLEDAVVLPGDSSIWVDDCCCAAVFNARIWSAKALMVG